MVIYLKRAKTTLTKIKKVIFAVQLLLQIHLETKKW